MASNIVCNTEELTRRAQQMRTYIKQERSIISNLNKKLNSLGYVWAGVSSQAFLLNYTMRKMEIQGFLSMLDDFVNFLETCADEFDQTDENMRRKVNNV